MKSKNLFSTKGFFTLLLSVFAFSISAQNVTVSGTVTDDTGLEVIGATVIVAGRCKSWNRNGFRRQVYIKQCAIQRFVADQLCGNGHSNHSG
ncbi:hypothetical protein SDC9_102401 [bioreactor metagenome]|uniref:Uncharacterized protein n=1 Tax=bioreactor metagenome TaxID=1076179 RepID=A0A645B1K6_9ZZZZ